MPPPQAPHAGPPTALFMSSTPPVHLERVELPPRDCQLHVSSVLTPPEHLDDDYDFAPRISWTQDGAEHPLRQPVPGT